MKPMPRAVQWVGELPGCVRILDQTLLPGQIEYRDCHTVEEVWEACAGRRRSASRRRSGR
jgi:methylthioribose-1-phosphate isomerase